MTILSSHLEGDFYAFTVESGSNTYDVRIDACTGLVDCSCKGFAYWYESKNPTIVDKTCKHVGFVVRFLLSGDDATGDVA